MTTKQSVAKQRSQDRAKVRVAVVGARGYTGLELARLLLKHPMANLVSCFATSSFQLSDSLAERRARDVRCLSIDALESEVSTQGIEVVFLATPAETSVQLAPRLLKLGVNVIDLSGAFRLAGGNAAGCIKIYEKWYGFTHAEPELVAKAEYGLMPWYSEGKPTEGPRLIANPGCFATAVLMAVLPLLKSGLIEASSLVIDAKSGTTGAGRKAEERLLHAEVDGLCLPYRVGRHQHEPEIQTAAAAFAGVELQPFFTTHLLNVRRGIVSSVYAKCVSGVSAVDVEKAFAKAYGENSLVEVACLDEAGAEKLLNLRRVVGTPRTQIAWRIVDDRLYVFSLIDNLLKGAASQAVENFNRVISCAAETGLEEMEGLL
jgi:N-acetyl-gamma-glutamyl-phosphate reductase